MKRSFFAGLGLLAVVAAVPAAGADLPQQMPSAIPPAYVAPSFYNWTGFYIGAQGGYAWSNNGNLHLDGGFVGGQIGFNWQPVGSPWVFGLEVDSVWADIGKSGTIGDRGRCAKRLDQCQLYGIVSRSHRLCLRPHNDLRNWRSRLDQQ